MGLTWRAGRPVRSSKLAVWAEGFLQVFGWGWLFGAARARAKRPHAASAGTAFILRGMRSSREGE